MSTEINNLFDFETISSMHSSESSYRLESSPLDRKTTRSLLLVAATGLGKTVCMAGLAKHWPHGRVMMLSHRFELNQQARASFSSVCNEDVALEQANYHADQWGDKDRIVVASVQTLVSKRRGKYRMEKFDPNDFGLIMIDEAHRSAAASYQRIFDYFKQNEHCCFLGVTATPDRLDGVGLGCVFDEVACNLDIAWGLQNGWLVPPRQMFVQVDGLDFSQVKTKGGDLDQQQLAKIVEMEENLHSMAKPIVDVTQGKQAIVFTASVGQAHRLAEIIRDYHQRTYGAVNRDTAVSLDGSLTPQDPRRQQIVKDFKNGTIQYLVNCGVATEGFDAPATSVIAIGRPTKSRALYTQMVGRGTRPLPGTVDQFDTAEERLAAISASGKPDCLVLDFVGQSSRHKLICTTDILGGENEPPEVIERANRLLKKNDFKGTTLDALREAREKLEAEREAKRAKLTMGVNYKLREAKSVWDMATVPKVSVPGYLVKKPVTEKQRGMLIRLGFNEQQISEMNPKSGSAAIDYAIKNPRTSFGQWLNKKVKANGEA